MKKDKRHKLIEAVLMIATYLITPVVILFLCSLLSGCKTVERESVVVKSDTLHHYTHSKDSVVYRDSVFVHLYEKGDTIYSITERWNVQYRDRVRVDTVYKSVAVVQQQTERTEKKAPWYERYMSWVWAVAVVGCFMFGMWCSKRRDKT